MQVITLFFSTLVFITISLSSSAQSMDLFPAPVVSPYYNNCAAILFKGKMLVNEYTPKGRCNLERGMKGKLTVAAVNLTDEGATPIKNIGFKVAIRNQRTNTLWMYSDEAVEAVQLEEVLEKCEKGDRIIIMTVDRNYSLPHHEISLDGGC